MTNIIVAYDENRAIGVNGDLPWGYGLPGDLALFKRLTSGNTVVMGRITYESIGRPLSNRENIVVSRNSALSIEGVVCVTSLAAALKAAAHEVFVIGGAQLYQSALLHSHSIYATEVHASFEQADTHFPTISDDEWAEASRVPMVRRQDDAYEYDFVRYDRSA